MAKDVTKKLTQGISQTLSDVFSQNVKARDTASPKTGKPKWSDLSPNYPKDGTAEQKIKHLVWKFYLEAGFEKVQFARKWMRNALMFQGYHELEWSEINVAWEAIIRDSGDYAFPNNYYRSHVMYGAALYLKNEPKFQPQPTSEDYESHAAVEAASVALEIIKENVNYDTIRTQEAIYLRLFGNSFRYSYYSLDPRYGYVTAPSYSNIDITLDDGYWLCQVCGLAGEGTNVAKCPNCGAIILPDGIYAPTHATVPVQTGQTRYPRGQEITEIVSPMEMYMRSSSPTLWYAPFLIRARVVDLTALQADFPDVHLDTAYQDGGGGDAFAASQDISLIYQQSLADLPGDPTQYAAWYERTTSYTKGTLLQGWIRPSQYAFDKELKKEYPHGLYAAVVGDKLLESRDESMDDHWVHFKYNPVPGRIWGDGDDDLIPKQLQLNETERLILRNVAYNSVPQTAIDSQRIDVDSIVNDPAEIIQVKQTGRPVKEAIEQLPGQQLTQEVWVWRDSQLKDMEYHSGVFGSAIGQHQAGVDTLGGQEQMASRAEQNLSPLLLMYKEANEQWARQILRIAAENWIDDRVQSVYGINGQWQFKKLKGTSVDPDKIKLVAKLIPTDFSQQQALSQAVASQLLNPFDPRVQTKALELYQLPTELSGFQMDTKVQWKEIEKMRDSGQQVQPRPIVDNDDAHIEICRTYLNSDKADSELDVSQLVFEHLQLHLENKLHVMQLSAPIEGANQEIHGMMGTQPTEGGGGQAGGQQQGGQGQQAGKRGGQVPPSQGDRQARAMKGQAAKPKRPQPPEGNQYGHRPA